MAPIKGCAPLIAYVATTHAHASDFDSADWTQGREFLEQHSKDIAIFLEPHSVTFIDFYHWREDALDAMRNVAGCFTEFDVRRCLGTDV